MNERSIIAAVARRFRSVTSAKTNWFNEAWSVSIEEAKQSASRDQSKIKGFSKKLDEVAAIFRSLAGPLKSPKISEYADRIDGIIKDIEGFSQITRECVSLMDDLDREWESLMKKVVKDRNLKQEALKAVEKLPTYKKYLALAERAGVIQDKITGIYESYDYIDWTLENYVGGEAGIYQELEDKNPGNPFDDLEGCINLFGVMVLYTEEEVLENWLEDSKN